MSSYVIVNGLSETFDLTPSSSGVDAPVIRPGQASLRMGLLPRFGRHGSDFAGDEMSPAREIRLSVSIVDETDAGFLAKLAAIRSMFLPHKAPFYLLDQDNDRLAWIRLATWGEIDMDNTRYRYGVLPLTLSMLDAVWESDPPEELTGTFTSGDTLSIDYDGTENAWPTIDLVAVDDNPDFRIENETNGSGMTVDCFDFLAGSRVRLDGDPRNGQVALFSPSAATSGSDIRNQVSDGSYLFLQEGNNVIRYTGPDVDYIISYRKLWLD